MPGTVAFRGIVGPYLLTRAIVLVVALVAAAQVPFGVACDPCDLSSSSVINALTRWDAGWYLSIARDGYSYTPGVLSNVTFSPLLPALMRGTTAIAGRVDDTSLLVAGLVVVNLALLVALAYLVALGRRELGEDAARRAGLYLLVFPTTVFLSVLYPTSLFLAAAAGTVFEARRGHWWRAGLLAALGTLARPFGIALVVPLVVQALVDGSLRARGRVLAAMGLPVAAFLLWQAYLYRVTGDPLVYLHAQAVYGRRPSLPFGEVGALLDPATYGFPWLVGGIFVLVSALVVASWRVLHPATAACGTAILLGALSSGTLTSFPRYALVVFPAFLVLGALGTNRAFHVACVAISASLSLLLTAMFASWYWIG